MIVLSECSAEVVDAARKRLRPTLPSFFVPLRAKGSERVSALPNDHCSVRESEANEFVDRRCGSAAPASV